MFGSSRRNGDAPGSRVGAGTAPGLLLRATAALPAILAGCDCDCPERTGGIACGFQLEGTHPYGGPDSRLDLACTVESVSGEVVQLGCDEAGATVSRELRVTATPAADLGFLVGRSVTVSYQSIAWEGARLWITAGGDGVVLVGLATETLPLTFGSLRVSEYDANCARVANDCGDEERIGVRLTDGAATVDVFDGNVGDLEVPRPVRVWVSEAKRQNVMWCTEVGNSFFSVLIVRPPVR
ncbi:MAG: hypothetical protein HY907_19645 [Deltaproteobacteria bacterium]|nr:hypothetical protein [Deltaproteobacteria bacterium]